MADRIASESISCSPIIDLTEKVLELSIRYGCNEDFEDTECNKISPLVDIVNVVIESRSIETTISSIENVTPAKFDVDKENSLSLVHSLDIQTKEADEVTLREQHDMTELSSTKEASRTPMIDGVSLETKELSVLVDSLEVIDMEDQPKKKDDANDDELVVYSSRPSESFAVPDGLSPLIADIQEFKDFQSPQHLSESIAVAYSTPILSVHVEQEEVGCTPLILSFNHLKDLTVHPFLLNSIDENGPTLSSALHASNMLFRSYLTAHGVQEIIDVERAIIHSPESLSREDVERYNSCIEQAVTNEANGDLLAAADWFVQAVAICDADLMLHGKLAWLFDELKNF